MSEKELLYMEDAIMHEDALISICSYTSSSLQDKNLKSFIDKQLKKHETLKEKLLNVLEESTNE